MFREQSRFGHRSTLRDGLALRWGRPRPIPPAPTASGWQVHLPVPAPRQHRPRVLANHAESCDRTYHAGISSWQIRNEVTRLDKNGTVRACNRAKSSECFAIWNRLLVPFRPEISRYAYFRAVDVGVFALASALAL